MLPFAVLRTLIGECGTLKWNRVSCKEGKVSVKLSRFGAGYFFGCSRYPDCLYASLSNLN